MDRLTFWLAIFIVGFLTLVGCSAYLAASQPPKVDLDAFSQGAVTRDVIVAKLGTRTSSVSMKTELGPACKSSIKALRLVGRSGTRRFLPPWMSSALRCRRLSGHSSTEGEMIQKRPALKYGTGDMEFGTILGSISRNGCFEKVAPEQAVFSTTSETRAGQKVVQRRND